MNSEYLIFYVLFSLYHLSSPGSMISLMFFDGRASSGLARCVMFLANQDIVRVRRVLIALLFMW